MLLEIISGVNHTGTHFNIVTHSTLRAISAIGIFMRNSFNSLLYNGPAFMILSVIGKFQTKLTASEINKI